MAIILDEENNVVTVENQPEAKRTLFKNISDGNGGAIDEILERLDRIYPETNSGFISNTGAVQSATADAEVYTAEFPVTPGNKVSVTLKYTQDRSMWLAYCLYDASHTFISRTMLVNSVTQKEASVSFTVPEGAYYCRLTYRSFNDAIITIDTTGPCLNDVQVLGKSVVKNGVADIPVDSSAFYGMAKAAGDLTQALSDNEVGTYTDEAKIAIQKMLGIYEAPWEVIKDGTFTNETEADYTINTDSNNQPFELTDVRVVFSLPQQETEASKGDYGRIRITGSLVTANIFLGSWTQAAGATSKGGYGIVEQTGRMLKTWFTSNAAEGSDVNIRGSYRSIGTATASQYFQLLNGTNIITSIAITSVKGTGKYTIYGKRKWQ